MRKHSTWLWVIIIVVVIISFVVFFSPTSQMPGAGGYREGNFGSIDGRRVTREEYSDAQREVLLRHFFSTGSWPNSDDETLMRDTYFRLFLTRKLAEYGIRVSPETGAQLAAQMLRSVNRGNPVPLDVFANQVLRPQGLGAGDFARFVEHDLGIQELAASAGLAGTLVTPREVRSLYEREHTEVSAKAVFFIASNYLAQVATTPELIAEFYTNQMAAYRLPERVQVAYVEFPATNFLDEAAAEFEQDTTASERVEATYERLGGTNFFRDAKSPEEAKETIRKQLVMDAALLMARKKAYEFSSELSSIEPAATENLGKLAERRKLTVKVSDPFDRNFAPDELKVRADFVQLAFGLTPDEPFAGPIVGENAAFVISLSQRLPSEIPSMESIKSKVTDDYRMFRAMSLARQAGGSFAALLAAGIPNGKSFTDICSEAEIKPVQIPPLALSTPSLPDLEQYANLNQIKQAAFTQQPGKPGEFIPTAAGGFVLFVESKLPLDETKMQSALPNFTIRVRRARENEAFNDWFRREAERGLRDTPALRPPTQPSGAPAS